MLECSAPSQRDRPCPQLQPEIQQRAEQHQRGGIKQNPVSARRSLRGKLTLHDQRANDLLFASGRRGDQRLQRGVGRRQQVVQYAAMRDRRLNRFGVGSWAWQSRKLLQPILDVARRGRRGIEREVQHGSRERGSGRDHRNIV